MYYIYIYFFIYYLEYLECEHNISHKPLKYILPLSLEYEA